MHSVICNITNTLGYTEHWNELYTVLTARLSTSVRAQTMLSIPWAAEGFLHLTLWAHTCSVCKLGRTFEGRREKVVTGSGWSSLGEMREEWEIRVASKRWLLDLCVLVPASSWCLRTWHNWRTTSPPTAPATPWCTSPAVGCLPAQPLLQCSLLTHYAPA